MKKNSTEPKYTEEPADAWKLPADAPALTRAQEQELGLLSPADIADVDWDKVVAPDRVVLQPRRGGPRPGAGRKPKHHVRMQILVPHTTREKIRRIARKRGLSMSTVVADALTQL
jgi:hypothetical protein